MADFRPFRGFLPAPELAGKAVSKPFDNYSKEEVREIIALNPHSFLHVILPAIPTDDHEVSYAEKLELGKKEFLQLTERGTFLHDAAPSYYIYRQTNGEDQYTGIIGAISIDDCINNIVKPHEQTIEHKEVKLKEYLDIIDINAEPVVISYKADHLINEITDEITAAEPGLHIHVPGFGTHELWKVTDEAHTRAIGAQFAAMDEMYICDGHHRTASSVLLGQEKRAEHADFTGKEGFNYFMAVMFPHHQIRLREFNRLVKDLNGISHDDFILHLRSRFEVLPSDGFPDITDEIFSFAVYLDQRWYQLVPRKNVLEGIPEENLLPTQLLTDLVLAPILDIHDLRRDKRIAFKGGRTDHNELMQLVDSGAYRAAFVVNKITIPIFKKFADNGWFMPPKSTWFEPKLLNGLVIYSLTRSMN